MTAERPWVANVGEGCAEHCPRAGMVPRDRYEGEWDQQPWHPAPNTLPTVCVSITEPGRKARLTGKGFVDILRLGFQDYDSMRPHPDSAVLFDVNMAARLARFLRKYRGHNIVVHCAAGISRSGAVAETVLAAFPEYVDRGWMRHPNGLVVTLLKRALGLVPLGYEEPRYVVSERFQGSIRFTNSDPAADE